MQRRQLVDDRGVARLELRALGVGGKQVERRAPDDLPDERPRLAGRAEVVVQRQFVQRGPLGEIDEREELIQRQHPLEDDAVHVGDDAAPGVDARVAHRERQQARQEVAESPAVVRIQSLSTGVRKDRDRVGADDIGPAEHGRRNLLAQVVLNVGGCLICKHPVVVAHCTEPDMFIPTPPDASATLRNGVRRSQKSPLPLEATRTDISSGSCVRTRIGIELTPVACRVVEVADHRWIRRGPAGDSVVRSFGVWPALGRGRPARPSRRFGARLRRSSFGARPASITRWR